MAFVHASEKPDRQIIAAKLNDLADRVAGTGPKVVKGSNPLLDDAEDLVSQMDRTIRMMQGIMREGGKTWASAPSTPVG
jgi:hypothetical protein